MPRDFFQTHITILGLISYISDVLKVNEKDSKEIKENLLAAVFLTFNSKLLKNPEISEIFKQSLANNPNPDDIVSFFNDIQNLFKEKQPKANFLSLLKESAREVLDNFLTKSQKPELVSQINSLLE